MVSTETDDLQMPLNGKEVAPTRNDSNLISDLNDLVKHVQIVEVCDKLEKVEQNLALKKVHPNVDRLWRLKEIQKKHDQLEHSFFEERAALIAKYHQLYKPFYNKRSEIVSGVVEVTANAYKATEVDKGVPEFWITAMKNNEVLVEEIQELDEEALKYLRDIKWCRLDDSIGFKLEFLFNPNPYFKNSVLTKIYQVNDEDVVDPVLDKVIGTEMEWYQGKNLTKKLISKKPNKGSKNRKPVVKLESRDSFFNFFSPPVIPGDDEQIKNKDANWRKLQKQLEKDYEIGTTIRDTIIPNAFSWFIGEAIREGGFNLRRR